MGDPFLVSRSADGAGLSAVCRVADAGAGWRRGADHDAHRASGHRQSRGHGHEMHSGAKMNERRTNRNQRASHK